MAQDNFAGLLPWGPSGLASSADEVAISGAATRNPWAAQMDYLTGLADSVDQGDEHYEQNTFAYIPTELQVGPALAVINAQINATAEPIQSNDPTLTQLMRSLYQRSSELWQEIAAADTEGWSI